MIFKVNDLVSWDAYVNGVPEMKAGKIFAVVSPGSDPRKLVPPGFSLNTRRPYSMSLTYLVTIPNCKVLYWPETLKPLPKDKEFLLYTQYLPDTKLEEVPKDVSDRKKLVTMLELVGCEYVERPTFVTNITGGMRFWFEVVEGVESIKEVEYFHK